METVSNHKWTFINVASVIALSVVINIINTYVGFSIFPVASTHVEPVVVQIPAENVIQYSTTGEYSEYCLNDGNFDKQFQYMAKRGEVSVGRYHSGIGSNKEWTVSFDNSSFRYDAPVKVQYKSRDEQLCKAMQDAFSKIVDYKL